MRTKKINMSLILILYGLSYLKPIIRLNLKSILIKPYINI